MTEKNDAWFEHVSLQHIRRAIQKADSGLLRDEDAIARDIFANLKAELGGPQTSPRGYDEQLKLADSLREVRDRLKGPIRTKRANRRCVLEVEASRDHKEGEGICLFQIPAGQAVYADLLYLANNDLDLIIAALDENPRDEILSPTLRGIRDEANSRITALFGKDQYRLAIRPIGPIAGPDRVSPVQA